MDSAGFLIMHEDFLLYSATAKDVESVHITEKEKNIAEHLIKNNYLKKKECRNLKEIQKQSFYEVDLENEVVDILKSGDSCSKYQLNKIPGTNAYLGLSIILDYFLFIVFLFSGRLLHGLSNMIRDDQTIVRDLEINTRKLSLRFPVQNRNFSKSKHDSPVLIHPPEFASRPT